MIKIPLKTRTHLKAWVVLCGGLVWVARETGPFHGTVKPWQLIPRRPTLHDGYMDQTVATWKRTFAGAEMVRVQNIGTRWELQRMGLASSMARVIQSLYGDPVWVENPNLASLSLFRELHRRHPGKFPETGRSAVQHAKLVGAMGNDLSSDRRPSLLRQWGLKIAVLLGIIPA